jgi:signal transduction histidine kinase
VNPEPDVTPQSTSKPDAARPTPGPNATRPKRASARLGVEQRVLAALALAGLVFVASASLTTALALAPEQRAVVAEPGLLGSLVAVLLGATLAAIVHVALRLPEVRWPRPGGEPGTSPWPLALLGWPSLLVWPLLIVRDRRAAAREHDPQEVELGFRQLLAIPRVAATKLVTWLGAATLVASAWIAQATPIDLRVLSLATILALVSLLSLASLLTSRIRAMLVPEYLAAPRPDPLALPIRRSLAVRLGGPAGLALLAAVTIPTLVGVLWSERIDGAERREQAQRHAAELRVALEAGELERAHALVEHNPGLGIAQRPRTLGRVPSGHAPKLGFVDFDGDGEVDHWVVAAATGELVSAAITPAADHNTGLFAVSIALGLLAGLAALTLLLRDVERDIDRASRQVAAVAEGTIPEPMAVDTFATAELRVLVDAVDRLVGRISDANVTKYVLIEKGHEADRLKSQFLANMSHDLRSPLNSVLGFSDLLMTGIDGELEPSQRERVAAIHQTGKALLQQIDDILDTAKIEAGRMELHREPTPPATLIARAIQRARVRLDTPVDFNTTFAPGLPPAFMDPYRTVQALENVLLFAAEGLDHGTVEIRCEAPSSKSTREIVIRIVSPRASVPLAQLEQARRGFFRLPGQTGLGLGLPMATSILELQGGSLTIEDGSSSSLNGRAAMAFELRMPALTSRRVSRPRVQLGTRSD